MENSITYIGHTLADAFIHNFSVKQCSDEFLRVKNAKQKRQLNFYYRNIEDYKEDFSIKEVKFSHNKAYDTAAGHV